MGDIDKLIQLVKQTPVLYDTSHTQYGQIKMKSDIWNAIAIEANFPTGSAARVGWESLRNRHREALRRQRNKVISNTGAGIKQWQYQYEMQFLLPYMKNRSSLVNFEGTAINGSSINNSLEPTEEDEEDIDNELGFSSSELKSSTKIVKTQSNFQAGINNYANKSVKVIDNKHHDFEQATCVKKKNHDDDALYHFFISMYNTTKEMPKHIQCSIKRKFSSIVFEEEEKLLNEIVSQSSAFTNSLQSLPRSTESSESIRDRNQLIPSHTNEALLEEHQSPDNIHSLAGTGLVNNQPNSSINVFSPFIEKYEPL